MPTKVQYDLTADSSGVTNAVAQVDQALSDTAATAADTAQEIEAGLNRAEQAASDLGDTAAGTDKEIDRVEKGLKDLSEQADEAGGELGKVHKQLDLTSDAAGDLGDKGQKLSGILGMFSPVLGDAAQSLGDFTDFGEVALEALGGLSVGVETVAAGVTGLGVVMLAGAAIYSQYEAQVVDSTIEANRLNRQIIEQGRVASKSADEIEQLNTAWGDFLSIGDDLDTQFKVINGQLSEQQVEIEKARNQAIEAARANLHAQGQEIASRKARIAAIDAEVASGDARSDMLAQDFEERNRLVAELDRETAKLGEMRSELDRTLEKQELLIEYKYETAKADEAKAKATEQAADADARAAEQAASLAALEAEQIAALDAATAKTIAYQTALDGMASTVQGVTDDLLTPLEKLQAEQDKAQAALLEQYTQAAIAAVGNAEAQLAAYRAFREGQASIDAVYQAKKDEQAIKDKEAQDKAAKEAQDKAQAEIEALQAQEVAKRDMQIRFAQELTENLDGIVQSEIDRRAALLEKMQEQLNDNAENLTQAEKAELEKRIKNHRIAQAVLFRVTQIASAANAAVTGFQAAQTAYKDGLEVGGPAGLILGPIAAGTSAAFTAVQIAGIMAQKPAFHSGGFGDSPTGGLAPDEYLTRKTRNEATLNPVGRSSLGDDTIRRANRGELGRGGEPLIVVYKHDHRVLDVALQDNYRNGGELARVGNSRYRVGHRKQ
jgi:hypothetical protein